MANASWLDDMITGDGAVKTLMGYPVADTLPEPGQVLSFNGAQWVPITPEPPIPPVTDHSSLTGRTAVNSHPATAISVASSSFTGPLRNIPNVQQMMQTIDNCIMRPSVAEFLFPQDGMEFVTSPIDVQIKCYDSDSVELLKSSDNITYTSEGFFPNTSSGSSKLEFHFLTYGKVYLKLVSRNAIFTIESQPIMISRIAA